MDAPVGAAPDRRLALEPDLGIGVAAFVQDEAGRVLFIQENYGQRRFGFPGGAVENGESLHDALLRECREEICADVAVDHLIAIDYYSRTETGGSWLYALFACRLEAVPAVPTSGEIADVLWIDPADPPTPLTNAARKFLQRAVAGERGVVGWVRGDG